jgi:hypothetical protein
MSLTPLDESDRKPREGGPSPDDGRDDSRPGILKRAWDALGRVTAAITGGSPSEETTVEPRDDRGQNGGNRRAHTPVAQSHAGSDARAAERSLTWADGAAEKPPEPEDAVDRPELVASWDDRGLTLSEAGDSGATIASDTWTDIER